MSLNKCPAPVNFRYPENYSSRSTDQGLKFNQSSDSITFTLLGDGLVRVTSEIGSTSKRNYSTAGLTVTPAAEATVEEQKGGFCLRSGGVKLETDARSAAFRLLYQDSLLVESVPAPFGACGEKSICLLSRPENAVVYGLGEKTGGLDKSCASWKMWNVDVVADFPHSYWKDDFDPSYVSIPFFITHTQGAFYGVYLDNPFATFFHLGLNPEKTYLIPPARQRKPDEPVLAFGAEEGLFEFYLIPGPTLSDVVRRFARLTGVHEMPPLWALGYQQCRWGYKSARELDEVSEKLVQAGIPAGGLWMDIDYMDGYRCFTFHPKTFTPEQRKKHFQRIENRGSKLVTIIDPGIKPDYHVYREGDKQGVFCLTPEGEPFRGYVWPGETVFPDFALSEGRRFWAERIREHLDQGISGIWIDMNDPSCGPVSLDDLRFERGNAPHSAYHNQYGHLMAQATWEGFTLQDPDRRPFVLTRSGYTGTQKYSAIWTGDNASNETHLAMAIPMSLNLALSGVSFNGPDVGGFAFDTTEALMTLWMQAGALFPFLRNHSTIDTRHQEPYAFSKKALATIRKCIHTRAKLLPWIYNQFYFHHRDGDAVMRPLAYEFEGKEYQRIEDQYLIGPSLMVAPFTRLQDKTRKVVLPPGWWYSLISSQWIEGGQSIEISRHPGMNLFIRDGAILPCLEPKGLFPQPDFRKTGFHVFVKERMADCEYYEDDCTTRAYQRGTYNLYRLRTRLLGGELELEASLQHRGYDQGLKSAPCYFYGQSPAKAKPAKARWPFGTYTTGRVKIKLGE